MGKVFLVGSGPGDPDLLTMKAARLLAQADVVLHDALVSDEILVLIRPEAQVIDIGKRRGHKLLTQDEINSLLVHFARVSSIVVRLKGGDPSIFGRAGEEIEALSDAGVEFEIVPGITSALAGAAAAGVSLTDRRYASSVVFTTGHRAPGKDGADWDRLVTSNSTVVIYMPGQDYSRLATQLVTAGLAPHTPCAVVSAVGRVEQQIRRTNLSGLTTGALLPAPALLIVGRCASPLSQVQALGGGYVDRPDSEAPSPFNRSSQ
jgi:uroporphyrin-III C-methyltransferase